MFDKAATAVKNHWERHSTNYRHLATAALVLTTIASVGLAKSVRYGRDQYLKDRGLTDDFNTWLFMEED